MARTREREKVEAEIVKIASEKYRDNGDGTVTDITTKFAWIQKPLIINESNMTMTWNKAVSACSELGLGGLKGWRLPTRAELKTIIYEESVKEILIDTHDNKYLGESSKRDEIEIWTADDAEQVKGIIHGNVLWVNKWVWSYKNGWRSSDPSSRQYNHKVLCVRKGDNGEECVEQIIGMAGQVSYRPCDATIKNQQQKPSEQKNISSEIGKCTKKCSDERTMKQDAHEKLFFSHKITDVEVNRRIEILSIEMYKCIADCER